MAKKKAAEPTELVGFDEFDPADLEAMAEKQDSKKEVSEAQAKEYLERRRLAYINVFTKGNTDQADIDIVLFDLLWFCRGHAPTFDVRDGIHADTLMKMKEGRREVLQRILDHARLDRDALFVKYTNAITK